VKLLVINPNTGKATTDRLAQVIQAQLPVQVNLTCVTAAFGFAYIASEESYAVATHAVLQTWKQYQSQHPDQLPDRILLGCFGDPGLFAMREVCSQPVHALAQASFVEASAMGDFAIVTGGERWRPMLQRLAAGLGYGPQLKLVETVSATGAQLLADQSMAIDLLTHACQQAQLQSVNSIILGGAGLAGYAQLIQPFVSVPVIDSVQAGVRQSLL
jgi:allantoin racemase